MNILKSAFLVILFAGCSRTDDPSMQAEDNAWLRLDDGAVVMRVNGLDYTKGMIDRDCSLHDQFIKIYLDLQKTDPTKAAEIRDRADDRYRNELLEKRILKMAILSAMRGKSASDESVSAIRGQFSQEISGGRLKFEEIAKLLEEAKLGETLARNVQEESLVKDYAVQNLKQFDAYTLEQAKRDSANLVAYNKEAAKTNKVIYARAEKAAKEWKENVSGKELASRYFTNAQFGGAEDLGVLTKDDFFLDEADGSAIWKAIDRLEVGEVTSVLDLEEGYAIYRRKRDAARAEEEKQERQFERLVFRRYVIMDELPPEAILARKTAELEEKNTDMMYGELMKKVKIEFPSGEEIIPSGTMEFVKRVNARNGEK